MVIQVSTPKERSKRPRKAKAAGSSSYHLHNEDTGMKNEVRTFEIERSQGLKMTLKKSTQDSTEPKEVRSSVCVCVCVRIYIYVCVHSD